MTVEMHTLPLSRHARGTFTETRIVMPGFMPGIHVLAALQHQSRGWHRKSGLPDLRIK